MGKKKLTILVSDETEDELREYIIKNYKRPYGKLSKVVEDSLKEYLKKEEETEEL